MKPNDKDVNEIANFLTERGYGYVKFEDGNRPYHARAAQGMWNYIDHHNKGQRLEPLFPFRVSTTLYSYEGEGAFDKVFLTLDYNSKKGIHVNRCQIGKYNHEGKALWENDYAIKNKKQVPSADQADSILAGRLQWDVSEKRRKKKGL